MQLLHQTLVFLLVLMLVLSACGANELDDMLFDDVNQQPCVRMIQAKGSVGCSSTCRILLRVSTRQ